MSTSFANLNLNSSSAASGSGIDVGAVVDAIIASEQAPEQIWRAQQSTLQTQANAFNSLSTSLGVLQSALNALGDISGAFAGQTATSSQPNLVSVTAAAGAAAGTHTIVVSNLATTSSYYTDPVATSSATLAHGSFTLTVGQGGGATSSTITIDGTNDTLDKLASYINANNYGVTASVLHDADGATLALSSTASGAPGDLTISANGTGLSFNKSANGTNASYTMDGVPQSSTTNTVSGTIPNVTLNLLAANQNQPVTISVSPDVNGITQAINNFVSAYNSVVSGINSEFVTDSSGNAGTLASNSALRSLQSSLLSDAAFAVNGTNGPINLASFGIDMQDDGTLTVDSAQLNTALTSQFSTVQNFFQSSASGSFGANFSTDLNTITDPTDGVIALNLNENTSDQKDLQNQIDDLEARLADRRTFLTNQYSQVDAMMRQYPITLQQIQSQLATLNTGSGK